jgi:hypothetical protein
VNTRNVHYWAAENPRWLRQVEHQRQWSVKVWYGVIGNRIIGLYFVEGNPNGERYVAFLLNILPLLLEDISLLNRMRMWYQHDCCTEHNAIVARNVLNRVYTGRWIGRGGPRIWPARSPDLTPLDLLWIILKDVVYQDVPTTPENMRQRITDGCAAMNPQVIERSRRSFIQRLQLCINVNDQHLEHLL